MTVSDTRKKVAERLEAPVSERPRLARLTKADLIKLIGFGIFIAIIVAAAVALTPLFAGMGTESGREELIAKIKGAGPLGVLMLLGLQLLQVIVAIIPGEVVQLVAGAMYGVAGGAAIILIGCVISSAILFAVVHRLGAPFVRDMIPEKWLDKVADFEQSEKLDVMVFVLFLIPGMPKDVLTYLVPLTDMPMRKFVIISNVARVPGVLMSMLAADGLINGDFKAVVIIAVAVGAIAAVGIIFREKIMGAFKSRKASGRSRSKHGKVLDGTSSEDGENFDR